MPKSNILFLDQSKHNMTSSLLLSSQALRINTFAVRLRKDTSEQQPQAVKTKWGKNKSLL